LPIVFKTEGTLRSSVHFQKLPSILLLASKAQTTDESIRKLNAIDR